MAEQKVVIITVGTTAEPILHTIRSLEGQAGRVWLLYGRSLGEQKPRPLDVVQEVLEATRDLDLSIEEREVPRPQDLDDCIRMIRKVVQEAEEIGPVLVDFTGGTKVLSAAAVHAALTSGRAAEVELAYTGGTERGADGRVRTAGMMQRIVTTAEQRLHEALNRLQDHQYREAAAISAGMPAAGRAGYVQTAVAALLAWEDFDYETSVSTMRTLEAASQVLKEDEALGSVARLCLRLRPLGGALSHLVVQLRLLDHPKGPRQQPWETMPLLVADTLENAARRLREGRHTDCVMRSYRAVEVAVHGVLLREGVNPQQVRWEALGDSVQEEARRLMRVQGLPVRLNLFQGRMLLQAMGQSLRPDVEARFKPLQRDRNFCHLEHGYFKISAQTAAQRLADATAIAQELLRTRLAPLRTQVRHEFT